MIWSSRISRTGCACVSCLGQEFVCSGGQWWTAASTATGSEVGPGPRWLLEDNPKSKTEEFLNF